MLREIQFVSLSLRIVLLHFQVPACFNFLFFSIPCLDLASILFSSYNDEYSHSHSILNKEQNPTKYIWTTPLHSHYIYYLNWQIEKICLSFSIMMYMFYPVEHCKHKPSCMMHTTMQESKEEMKGKKKFISVKIFW